MGVVETEDLLLHWVEWGRPGDPPMLWLHGSGSHSRTWDLVAPSVASLGYYVVALDQRGHGDTAWQPTADRVYGTRSMVTDVERFVEAMGWSRFGLLGLSMGGINAFLYAAAHAERVTRLAVLDIGPEVVMAGLRRISASAASSPAVFNSVEEALQRARRDHPLAPEHALRHRTEHALRPAPDGGFELKQDRALRDGSAKRDDHSIDERWAAWAGCSMPTLLVRGGTSDILDDDITERMLAANPRAELRLLDGVGHSLSLEAPDRLAAVLTDWYR